MSKLPINTLDASFILRSPSEENLDLQTMDKCKRSFSLAGAGQRFINRLAQASIAKLGQHHAVDKNRWRGFNAIRFAFLDVATNVALKLAAVEIGIESRAIQSDLRGEFLQ